LPYAFGAALLEAGFRLSAIDWRAAAGVGERRDGDASPFAAIYAADQMPAAANATDFALLWGRPALFALAREAALSKTARRLLYFSYVWRARGTSTARQRLRDAIVRQAARFAGGVVVMTEEQAEAVRRSLPETVPVIRLTVGIDGDFYAGATSIRDVAEADRGRVERLLQSPYAILPGDELRLNEDALTIVENSTINIARVCQRGHVKAMIDLKAEIARRNLGDRIVVFERISYAALRFLLRHAGAYAGLIDASWQPAGWTVACESLASGLPVVLYEGLVSRELRRLGAGADVLRAVPARDTAAFLIALQSMMEAAPRAQRAAKARAFASDRLNLERTGAAFAAALRQAIGAA
jgi:hypothetical protein